MLCIHSTDIAKRIPTRCAPQKWKKGDYVHWNISFLQCIILEKKYWKSCPFAVNARRILTFFTLFIAKVFTHLCFNYFDCYMLYCVRIGLVWFGCGTHFFYFNFNVPLCGRFCAHIFAHSHRVNTAVFVVFTLHTYT